MISYKDPENIDSILDEIKKAPTLGDIKILIDKYYPNWIIDVIEKYSLDYPNLNSNWMTVCKKCNTTPKKILIVCQICLIDKEHVLLNTFCELLTRSGFCVRKYDDFVKCKKCSRAIPCIELYNVLKNNGNKVPECWSEVCTEC